MSFADWLRTVIAPTLGALGAYVRDFFCEVDMRAI